MNFFNLLVLIIVLLLLVYILYYYFMGSMTHVSTVLVPLSSAITPYTPLKSATNTRYAYGAWVYVNNLNPNNNTVITRNHNFRLYVTPNAPQLQCDFIMKNGTTQQTIITNNFPMQRWCFIIVSVDNQFVDYYLNGKLVKSEKKQMMMMMPPDAGTGLTLGNSPKDSFVNMPFVPFDAYLGKVIHWQTPVDPQTAWTTYLNGNGVSNKIFPYHANLSFIKDNVTTGTYSLF